jgi:hypothetical protein
VKTVADPRVLDGLVRRLEGLTHFGAMLPKDWQRWGYRHTDHHLRQFGL